MRVRLKLGKSERCEYMTTDTNVQRVSQDNEITIEDNNKVTG